MQQSCGLLLAAGPDGGNTIISAPPGQKCESSPVAHFPQLCYDSIYQTWKEVTALNLEKVSVRLAWLLRHCREPLYVSEEGGWAEVEVILEALRKQYPEVNREILERIVAMDKKQRYAFDETGRRIRASQGHSIPGVRLQMAAPPPPEYLYHGTAERFLPAILAEGLKPMTRQMVHLSAVYETAVAVGSRHGKPVVLTVRAADFVADGHELYLSDNGVWQAVAVPPEYFLPLQMRDEI